MFDDFRDKSSQEEGLPTLAALWYSDMTSGTATLTLARKFLEQLIERTEDA